MPEVLNYESREENPTLPTAAKVVAWIFIVFGILSAFEMGIGLLQGELYIDLTCILNFGIGWGLLNRKPAWRTCALVILWIVIILIPIIVLMGIVSYLVSSGQVTVSFYGKPVVLPPIFTLLASIAIGGGMFVLTLWQYRVLVRPDVVQCFRKKLIIPRDLNETWHVIDDTEPKPADTTMDTHPPPPPHRRGSVGRVISSL